jgi:hypothetical protein
MDVEGRKMLIDRVFERSNDAQTPFAVAHPGGSLPCMTSSKGAPVSSRDRARQANAQRLADAQSRLKNQEQDLVSYFDATRDEAKVADELEARIARLQRDARTKLESTRRRRSEALAALKERGETYSSIAALVDLSVPEATKLVKSAHEARPREDSDDTHVQGPIGDAGDRAQHGNVVPDESTAVEAAPQSAAVECDIA